MTVTVYLCCRDPPLDVVTVSHQVCVLGPGVTTVPGHGTGTGLLTKVSPLFVTFKVGVYITASK